MRVRRAPHSPHERRRVCFMSRLDATTGVNTRLGRPRLGLCRCGCDRRGRTNRISSFEEEWWRIGAAGCALVARSVRVSGFIPRLVSFSAPERLCDSRQYQSTSQSAVMGCLPLIVHAMDSEFVDTQGLPSTVRQPALTGSACCRSRRVMTADSYMHSCCSDRAAVGWTRNRAFCASLSAPQRCLARFMRPFLTLETKCSRLLSCALTKGIIGSPVEQCALMSVDVSN